MNTYEMDQTVKVLTSLFPKMDWTEEMLSLFRRRIARFEIRPERIVEILEEHRMNTRRRSPDMMSVVRSLKEEAFAPKKRVDWGTTQAQDDSRAPAVHVQDVEHPGVLWRDKATSKDIIVSIEEYSRLTGRKLSAFRKKNPTPWTTKPYKVSAGTPHPDKATP